VVWIVHGHEHRLELHKDFEKPTMSFDDWEIRTFLHVPWCVLPFDMAWRGMAWHGMERKCIMFFVRDTCVFIYSISMSMSMNMNMSTSIRTSISMSTILRYAILARVAIYLPMFLYVRGTSYIDHLYKADYRVLVDACCTTPTGYELYIRCILRMCMCTHV
jgi:hypothetical protein